MRLSPGAVRAFLFRSERVSRVAHRAVIQFDRHSESLGVDALVGRLTPAPKPVNRDFHLAGTVGEVPVIHFIVATSAAGLLLFEGCRVTQLFAEKGYYGVTRRWGRWYAFHRYGFHGRIISFRLDGHAAVDARTEIAGLNRGVHQIDFIDGALWITDTYKDRVLIVPEAMIGRAWRSAAQVYYPFGREEVGYACATPAHLNSVLRWGDTNLVVAHNETLKTHRDSELCRLDAAGRVCDRKPLGGGCCHNIAFLEGEPVTCRSVQGTVAVGDRDVLSLDAFTRGLSIGRDYHIVGASAAVEDRAARDRSQTRIVITYPDFRPVATVVLDSTQVNEIRRVDADDLGLSSTRIA